MFPPDTRILIVDDSSFSRTLMRNCLKELKYTNIIEAKDVKTAVTFLRVEDYKKDPVHLIISDVNMPEVSGLQLLRWVREQDHLKDIPLMIVTTVQGKEGILDAGRLNVTHYMIKPFDLPTVKDRMTSAWEKHGKDYYGKMKARKAAP